MEGKRKPVVVFDLDDTLHMRAAPFANAVKERYGITEAEQIKRMFTDFRAIGVDYFHQWDAGTITEQEMYIRRTIDTFALYGYAVSEEDALLFHKTYEKYLQQIRPAEGIEDALQAAVGAGIQLGILTNGSPVRQRNKIRALGLTRWIPEEYIAVSLELGVHKPDPEVFVRYRNKVGDIKKNRFEDEEEVVSAKANDIKIREKVGTESKNGETLMENEEEKNSWWYVGDLYEHDIEPAIKAGWHTVWMVHDEEDKTVQRELDPDYIVRSGKELEAVLLQIAERKD